MEREKYIDYAKGLGIILVILGHVSVPNQIITYIFSFHMPLFVFLSGLVFRQDRMSKNIKSLAKSYIIMSCLVSIPRCIYHAVKDRSLEAFIHTIITVCGGGAAPFYRIDAAPAIWFLTSLISIEILSYLIHKFPLFYRAVVVICLVCLAVIYAPLKELSFIPWNMDVGVFLLPFFEIGREINALMRWIKSHQKFQLFCSIGTIILLIPLSRTNGNVNIYRCLYGNNIVLYYFNALLGIFGVVSVSLVLSGREVRWLGYIGRNTLIPMCIHQPIIMLFSRVFARFSILPDMIVKIIVFMSSFVTSYAIGMIIKKYFPYFIGKKKNKYI